MSVPSVATAPVPAPLREVELPAADRPLRADVNRLGALVG